MSTNEHRLLSRRERDEQIRIIKETLDYLMQQVEKNQPPPVEPIKDVPPTPEVSGAQEQPAKVEGSSDSEAEPTSTEQPSEPAVEPPTEPAAAAPSSVECKMECRSRCNYPKELPALQPEKAQKRQRWRALWRANQMAIEVLVVDVFLGGAIGFTCEFSSCSPLSFPPLRRDGIANFAPQYR